MSDQPLPDKVDIDSLGEEYFLIPYSLQFPDEDQPLPVACIVGNSPEKTLTSYIMGADGEWNQSKTATISESSELIGNTPSNVYESVIGVAGPDWTEIHNMKNDLSQYVDVRENINSPLISVLQNFSAETSKIDFCLCSTPKKVEDVLVGSDDVAIQMSVCESCGAVRSISYTTPNGAELTNESDIYSVSEFDAGSDPEQIRDTELDDTHLYTQPLTIVNKMSLLGICSWWQSHKLNPSEKQLTLPTEFNMTAIIRDQSIDGVILWSLFEGFVAVEHILLFEDLSEKTVGVIITEFAGGSDVYLRKPHVSTPFDSQLIEFDLATGSISFEQK